MLVRETMWSGIEGFDLFNINNFLGWLEVWLNGLKIFSFGYDAQ